MTDHQPRQIFIFYIRESQDQVDRLSHELESHGVNVCLARNGIKPGTCWKNAITSDQMVSIQTTAVKRIRLKLLEECLFMQKAIFGYRHDKSGC
jgi:hypothetical protein